VALGAAFRLKGRQSFAKFYESASIYRTDGMVLKVASGEKDKKHFAVAVHRKAGSAVRRNRVRRILTEWVRTHLDSFRAGFDYLVIVPASYKSCESETDLLVERLSQLARKAFDESDAA